jgi:hypothetical protein
MTRWTDRTRSYARHELKFLVRSTRIAQLTRTLERFLVPDAHGDGQGRYEVTSLYYDSPDYAFYRGKMDGLDVRKKLRVRTYEKKGSSSETPRAWVEVKERRLSSVSKRRTALDLDDALSLCAGDLGPARTGGRVREELTGVVLLVRAMSLRPRCIVTFRRQAFTVAGAGRRLRVTVDSALKGRVTVLDLRADARDGWFLPPSLAVLEVKAVGGLPPWIPPVLEAHGCRRVRLSKYCAALRHGMRGLRAAEISGERGHG